MPDSSSAPDPAHCIVRVALSGPLRRLFDYKVEDGKTDLDYPLGSRVEVPFGRGNRIGFVIEHPGSSLIEPEKLKAISKQLDDARTSINASSYTSAGSPISDCTLPLARWLANYYHHPIGDCLTTMLPNLLCRTGSTSQGLSLIHI